jgi:hypothetical protein
MISIKKVSSYILQKKTPSIKASKERGETYMPKTTKGREKILAFIKENGFSQIDLATQYGITSGDFADMLSGKDGSPRANRTILKIISDFRIR